MEFKCPTAWKEIKKRWTQILDYKSGSGQVIGSDRVLSRTVPLNFGATDLISDPVRACGEPLTHVGRAQARIHLKPLKQWKTHTISRDPLYSNLFPQTLFLLFFAGKGIKDRVIIALSLPLFLLRRPKNPYILHKQTLTLEKRIPTISPARVSKIRFFALQISPKQGQMSDLRSLFFGHWFLCFLPQIRPFLGFRSHFVEIC